ncbi:MAG TPA: glycosidase [Negativicutes bacterium]|nr:glycosidase [Negativicutes bacterium]
MNESNIKELFERYPKNPILTAADWPYTVNTVFNPGATLFKGKTLLLARCEERSGLSHLTKAVSIDGVGDWQIDATPTMASDLEHHPEERWGIEDPRITWIPEVGKWAVIYTAYSRGGPLVAMALTEDFVNFERLGTIMQPQDKDAAIFPRRFQGKWALLHRTTGPNDSATGHIWLAYSDDMTHWVDDRPLLKSRQGGLWDANKIGLCTPPLETKEGWVILYHSVRKTASGAIYRLGLALLDLENPSQVLNRSDDWIFGPTEAYERQGDVDDVVFPCGWVPDEQTGLLKMYYGGADSCIALATASMKELTEYARACPAPHDD